MSKKNTIKFKSARHFMAEPSPSGEINNQPSCTVPDQAMSIRQILDRFASGQDPAVGLTPEYDEIDDAPDFSKMSWEQKMDYKALIDDKIEKIREKNKQVKDDLKRYNDFLEDFKGNDPEITTSKEKPKEELETRKKLE